ncbi:MAG: winged helix-turn-helix domain-containing protein [Treponema sp.]|nr:winged helix-turn-helix domain-containing protein [Treponema sp.]
MKEKLKKIIPLAVLPIILVVCVGLWAGLSSGRYENVQSDENGTWDLQNFDFNKTNARLTGSVEFIPNVLLNPDEFAARENESIIGFPDEIAVFSTSRIRLLVPEGNYTFSRISTDYADRIFVNGIWLHDVGKPAKELKDGLAFTSRVTFTVQPIAGVIEIIQQTSNFSLRGKNRQAQDWIIGNYNYAYSVLQADFTVSIIIGCYLVLFLIFTSMYFFMSSYRPSLYFALFCLMWFLRSGITDLRIFASLLPWLSGYLSMRIEYISLPAAAILSIAIIRYLFPGVLHNIFCRIQNIVSVILAVLLLVLNIPSIVYIVLICQIFYFLCIVYILVNAVMKVREIDIVKGIFLTGAVIFLYGAIRDFSYYSFSFIPLLPPFSDANFTQITVLAFAFCEAAAVFISTMRKMRDIEVKNMSLETEINFLQKRLINLQEIKERQNQEEINIKPFKLNTATNMASINDIDMMLTPKEFALLLTFIQNEGRVLSAEYIYETIWGMPMNNDNLTLRKHISELRKKLEKGKSGYTISAEYGKGYYIENI